MGGSSVESMSVNVSVTEIEGVIDLQKHKGVADPLEIVGGELSNEAILLCLDEFMVRVHFVERICTHIAMA